MDALEAGSKVSSKKKRSLKDGTEMPLAPIKSQDSPATVSVTSPAPPPTPPIVVPTAASVSTTLSTATIEPATGDVSPVPLKPMFKVSSVCYIVYSVVLTCLLRFPVLPGYSGSRRSSN